MQANPVLSQVQLPGRCLHFVKEHGRSIEDLALTEQLTAHLMNLWDEGHVGRSHLFECMALFHELVDGGTNKSRLMFRAAADET
jgi:hypothetical protein